MNFDDAKNVYKILDTIYNNQEMGYDIICKIMKEKYDSEEFWKYLINKITINSAFILKYLNELNLPMILKYYKIETDLLNPSSPVLTKIIDENLINELVMYQQLTDTILFYLIINGIIDSNFWNIISKYQKLSETFIKTYDNKLNWQYISEFQYINMSLLTDYLDKIDWLYGFNNISLAYLFTSENAQLFCKLNIWSSPSKLQQLSPDILNKIFECIPLTAIYILIKYQDLSNELLLRIVNKYNIKQIWNEISKWQTLTEQFVEDNALMLDWDELSENYAFLPDELHKFKDHINYAKLSGNDYFSFSWVSALNSIYSSNITLQSKVKELDLNWLNDNNIVDITKFEW